MTVLVAVCQTGGMEMFQSLIDTLDNPNPDKRVQINKKTGCWHPVHFAAHYHNYDMAKHLLSLKDSNGDKIIQPEHCDKFLKHQCETCGDQEFFKFLLYETEFGSKVKDLTPSAIHLACENIGGTKERLNVLLNVPEININEVNRFHRTPLMQACQEGNTEAVKVLMQYKVKVNIQDHQNNTALHLACRKGKVEMVQLLLQTLYLHDESRRVRLDLINDDNRTPIDVARRFQLELMGDVKMAKFFTSISRIRARTLQWMRNVKIQFFKLLCLDSVFDSNEMNPVHVDRGDIMDRHYNRYRLYTYPTMVDTEQIIIMLRNCMEMEN